MKLRLHSIASFLGTLALASCYTWQPPGPQQGPRGHSLDQAPGGNRYWDAPADQQGPPPPGNDPAAIVPPNGSGQPQQPNDGGSYQPSTPGGASQTPGGGANNGTVGIPQDPNQGKPSTPPPANTKPSASSIPSGIPVPGKPGYVYSPWDKTAGIVDVQGMASGTKVKCPYTGKVFIVP